MNKCKISFLPDCEDYSEIILSITFFSTFISIFYFTYGVYIEEKIFKTELIDIVNNFTKSLSLLNNNVKDFVKQIINNVNISDLAEKDAEVASKNKKLIIFASIIVGIIWVVGTIISYLLSTKMIGNLFGGECGKFHFTSVLFKNIIVILLIGLTEFVFLTYFGGAYISADYQDVINILLLNIKTYKQKNNLSLSSVSNTKLNKFKI
jgi:hypothetical protein